MTNDTKENLISFVSEKTGCKDISISTAFGTFHDNKNVSGDELDLSSLEFIELAIAIEQEFQVEIDDDSLMEIQTIGDMAEYIESY